MRGAQGTWTPQQRLSQLRPNITTYTREALRPIFFFQVRPVTVTQDGSSLICECETANSCPTSSLLLISPGTLLTSSSIPGYMRPSISCAPLLLLMVRGVFAFKVSSSWRNGVSFTFNPGFPSTFVLKCEVNFLLHRNAKKKMMKKRLAVLPMMIAATRPEFKAVVWVPGIDLVFASGLAGESMATMFCCPPRSHLH